MNYRITILILSMAVALPMNAKMLRVAGIQDARTILVERGPSRMPVVLSGIAITDEKGAKALLEWVLASSWVLVEEGTAAGHLVYRSPDALFVNRELVVRGFARATSPDIEPEQHVTVTYLGEYNPMSAAPAKPEAPRVKAPPARKKVQPVRPPRVSGTKARGSGSGTSRRPKAPPSPSGRQ
jgi:hypothetical protein